MGPVPRAELRDDALPVALDGLRGEVEALAGLRRRLTLGRGGEDLGLALGERLPFQHLGEQARHAARLRARIDPLCTSV